MKSHLTGILALACLSAVVVPLSAQPFDINQPQSPPRPKPEWLKIIDQGQTDPRLKGYFTPEGVKVDIVADYPVVRNPMAMTFGDDGTLYVLEWISDGANWSEQLETVTYKDGTTRKVATLKKGVKDVVKVLRDTKGKGVYDEAKVILEDELPSSILLNEGWLYLSSRGTVRRFKQSKPDGPYDVKEVIAQGFGGNHLHQVSGMTLGNDGWLYLTAGAGEHYAEGSDGSRATVLRTGAVFRCRPDGSKMHVYSIGYRNPYRDVAFDNRFHMFHADKDNEDGSKFMGCRLMHVAEESDFGWRSRPGAGSGSPDPVRGAAFGELPGKLLPLLKTGRGAPAGLLFYNETRFPDHYRGLLFYPDAYRKLIRAYKVITEGSSFEVTEEFDFLKSGDPLFRPCQMVIGPDGAIYICDRRTDSGGTGHLSGDGKHGRIYRVRWAGTTDDPALALRGLDSWAKISKLSEEDLLKTLQSEDFSDRLKAQRELVRRGAKVVPGLREILKDTDQSLYPRLAALGALQAFWNDEVKQDFVKLLRDSEEDLRRLAAEALGLRCQPGDKDMQEILLQNLGDPDLAARRAIVLAMGRIAAPGAADALVNTFNFDEGKDAYYSDGLLRAIERTGKEGITRLIDVADSGVEKDRNKVYEAFLSLRTRPAADVLPDLLKSPHPTITQRAGLIRSYTNYLLDPPVALDPLIDYLAGHAEEAVEVKAAALEVLSSAGVLKSDKLHSLLLKLLDDKAAEIRLLAIQVVEHTRQNKAAPRLVKILEDGSRSPVEHLAVVRALRVLDDPSAVPLLKALWNDAKTAASDRTMRVEALRTLAALDAEAARIQAQSILDRNAPTSNPELLEAVVVLGEDSQGARLVGERFLSKKLPRELFPQVMDALTKHPDKDPELNKLLSEIGKDGLKLSLDRAEVERVNQLVQTKGNAQRGKALFLNSKVLACIHCHRLEGLGGSVGPDLTGIWESQSVAKIMESIVDPSKEIMAGYQTYTATTKKGQAYTGLKVSETADEVVLRDANAREIRIPTQHLDDVKFSKRSLMPDHAVNQLTFDQFIDLLAFLKNREAQESIQGMVLEFWVVGPFGGELKTAYPPENKPDPSATYDGEKPGEKRTWQSRQAEPNGFLNLRAIFNRDQSSAYALTYVYSPKAQKVDMPVGAAEEVQIWVNDKVVHVEQGVFRPAKVDQTTVAVELQEGWNAVLAKVVCRKEHQELYLRFTGGQGLRVSLRPDQK